MSRLKRILFVILVALLSVGFMAPTALALTDKYRYTSSEGSTIQAEDEFGYSDDCFKRSSFEGCSHLETLSAQIAISSASCYGDADSYETDASSNPRNVLDILTKMGFEDASTNAYYKLEKSENSAGVAVAHKTITQKGKDYTLIAIMPRSAGYKQEWAGNFIVGDGDIHQGFKAARDEILRFVKQYIAEKKISGDIKVWTAGHSRGGALANMIGGFFAGGGIVYFDGAVSITPEDVYCYTFATPRTIKNNADKNTELSVAANRDDQSYAKDTKGKAFTYKKGGKADIKGDVYGGIRNFISRYDAFPKLPPAKWGFDHYGTDIAADHGLVPESAMLEKLALTSKYTYDKYLDGASPALFERKTFDLATLEFVKDDDKNSAPDIGSFLDERLAGLLRDAGTNKLYVSGGYQEALKSLAGVYGMSSALVDEEVLGDKSRFASPLVYSYLAYASDRLIEEGRVADEDEAVTIVVADLLTYFTGTDVDLEKYTVDDLVFALSDYLAKNEDKPFADTLMSAIAKQIPEDKVSLLTFTKRFDKNYTEENGKPKKDIALEDGLKAFFIACSKGPDPDCIAFSSFEKYDESARPKEVRKNLYTALAFAVYDQQDLVRLIAGPRYSFDGSGKFKDLVPAVLDMLMKEKDEDGNVVKTYGSLAEAADAKLITTIDSVFEKPLETARKECGEDYADMLNAQLEGVKKNISAVRSLLANFLFYNEGKYNAGQDIKTASTFIGNISMVPVAHYNEIYIAYAKAAAGYDCGYSKHSAAGLAGSAFGAGGYVAVVAGVALAAAGTGVAVNKNRKKETANAEVS